MNFKLLSRFAFALGLALAIGFSAAAQATQAKENRAPSGASAMAQFRSLGKNDGYVREVMDDYWMGSQFNATAPTIVVGDDFAKRLLVGILDFDTSTLPDNATVTYATLEVRVVNFTARYGDPYLKLGDMYAEIVSPYFGSYQKLEAQDFEAPSFGYAGYFWPVTGSNQWSLMEVDPGALGLIDVYDHTQFRLYFFDDNEDTYSQGISFLSGNYQYAAFRPVLTVYFDVP